MMQTAFEEASGEVNMHDTLLYLSPDDILRAVEEVDAIDAVREALALHALGKAEIASEAYLAWTSPKGGDARSISMPGMLAREAASVGVKIINANNANPESGLPRASGLTILFDTETARPVCVMAAAYISALRTAAVSALASQILLASDATTAAIIGAGPLALEHCVVMAYRIPKISKLFLFDRVPERAIKLRHELGVRLPPRRFAVQVAVSAEAAIRQCDLVIACTTTRKAYIERDWLREGALAINVSLDDLSEEVLIGADGLYVDDWGLIAEDEHRLLGKLARAGRVLAPETKQVSPPARVVTGTLGQLVLNRCEGRRSDDELCVVNPFGMAIEDVSLAHRVYESALRRNIGNHLSL
jgi:N-[(2S)-2-amino-2-carboxyethyl]-L-glutamate dehydrogenase